MFLDIGNLIGLGGLYAKVNEGDMGYLILAAIFGGALVGAGVALGFSGNGSTGGLDVLSALLAKHTDIKQDVSGFIFDAILVIIGIIVFKNIPSGLIGVLSAFACSLSVQYIYVSLNTFVIVDIISDKTIDIQNYIHNHLGHASTVVDVVGGYSGENKKMIKVVIYHEEQNDLRQFVANVDPKAFVSFTTAKAINGEGFDPLLVTKKRKGIFLFKKQDNSIKSPQKGDQIIDNKDEVNS